MDETGAPATEKRRTKRYRIPRLKKWTIVLVEWLDAVLHEGEQSSESTFECAVRKSIGHFIKRDDKVITIAMEDDRVEDGSASDCDNVTSIPLGMVQAVTIFVPLNK